MSEGSSRNWIDRMGASRSGGPGASLPPGMAEPAQSGGPDDYATQLSLKEERLMDSIEFGPLEPMKARIAELQHRVHRSGAKRPATFGGFYLGRSQEERELRDLMRRLDVAQEMRTRAERLRADRACVTAEYEREISQLEHRLAEMRARRARNPRA